MRRDIYLRKKKIGGILSDWKTQFYAAPRVSIRASPKSRKQKAGEKGVSIQEPGNCAISQICSFVRKKKGRKRGEKRNEGREREREEKVRSREFTCYRRGQVAQHFRLFSEPFSESSGRLV